MGGGGGGGVPPSRHKAVIGVFERFPYLNETFQSPLNIAKLRQNIYFKIFYFQEEQTGDPSRKPQFKSGELS